MKVKCLTLDGSYKLILKDKLKYREAAYAVVVNKKEILLVKTKSTGKYWLPGGGIEKKESIKEGLKREVREETGIEIVIVKQFEERRNYFYYKPTNEAFDSLSYFFICEPQSTKLLKDEDVIDEESIEPRWVKLKNLKVKDWQYGCEDIFEKIKGLKLI